MIAVIMFPEAALFRSQASSFPLAMELEPRATQVSMCISNHIQGNGLDVKLIAASLPLHPATYPYRLEKKTPWSESASELHRPSDRQLLRIKGATWSA
jgi:hypothetical protein